MTNKSCAFIKKLHINDIVELKTLKLSYTPTT